MNDLIDKANFEDSIISDDFKNIIYSKNDCIWCEKAIELFIKNKIPFTEQKLDVDVSKEEITHHLKQSFNIDLKTFPQIIINNEYVGGYEDLKKYIKNELHKPLNDAHSSA